MYKSISILISMLFASCAYAADTNNIGTIVSVRHFNASNPDENVTPVPAVELWVQFDYVPDENNDIVNVKGVDAHILDINIRDTGFVEGQKVSVKREGKIYIVQKV